MSIAIWLANYLAFSVVISLLVGASIKRSREIEFGLSEQQDTELQDRAQIQWLDTGTPLNINEV